MSFMRRKDKIRIALTASVVVFVLSRCFDGVLALVVALVATALVAGVIIYDLATEKNKRKFFNHMWLKFFLFFLFLAASGILPENLLMGAVCVAFVFGVVLFIRALIKFNELCSPDCEERLNNMK
jgi:uncharacterized membrane protein HdeD (DUF308 family)